MKNLEVQLRKNQARRKTLRFQERINAFLKRCGRTGGGHKDGFYPDSSFQQSVDESNGNVEFYNQEDCDLDASRPLDPSAEASANRQNDNMPHLVKQI